MMVRPMALKQHVILAIVLLIALIFWCPQSQATEEEYHVLKPLAMGNVGDKPTATSEAPRETEPSLMIHLGTAHFDPLSHPPDQASNLPAIQSYAEETTGYYIVQFDGPVQPDWKVALQHAGAEIFDYVPEFAFMVRMPSTAKTVVSTMDHVRWVGIFQPSYRISQNAMNMMYTQASNEAAELVVLRINIFPGENLELMESRIQSLGGIVKEKNSTKLKTTFKVEIPANKIAEMAGINGIKWIEPAPQWKLSNDVSTDIMNVRAARNTNGLYGSGQTVGVADTGLDQGSSDPATLHDDFENGSGSSRVVTILDTGGDGDTSDTSGHGTHVAGSVLGNGQMSGSDPASNSFPATSLAGMAPKANLVFQALQDTSANPPYLNIPTDLNSLFNAARAAGADLHTNSWGVDDAGQYSSSSQDVDEYMWNNKAFLIQFAAGNAGIDMDADGVIDLYSVGSPATAKNCLTVGSSESDRPSGAGYDDPWATGSWAPKYQADPIASDHISNNDRGMAASSARGPTLDGRHKPDIVAPGTNILSTRSSLGGDGWGAYAANSNYVWMGGTSMANPLVAGAAALMREYLINHAGFTPPSAALIKAALLNSAEDISPGQYGFGADQEIPDSPVPNNVEGWGRLNLGDGVFPAAPANILYYDETAGLDTGGDNDYSINVTDSGAPLKVNLVWTDYPGTPAAQGGLVNDLDLQVTDPAAVNHYPDHASQKSSLSTLDYNSGNPLTWSLNNRRAMRFTPAAYPAFVESTTFYFSNENRDIADVDVVVYDDNGTGGLPGTELFRKTLSYVPSGQLSIGIQGVVINSGDFYIAIEKNSSAQGIFVDTDNPTGRSYWYNGTQWAVSIYTVYIQANIRTTGYSTTFDRVNNTLGITIDRPTVGAYTVRVAGFNVPQGPQPYALVASGHIQKGLAGILQFNLANFTVREDEATATITVTRTGGSAGAVSVRFATSDGTASSGSDYTAASGTLNWTNGDSADKQFSVSIANDDLDEGDETIILTLSNPTGGAALGEFSTATLTISDKVRGTTPSSGGGGGGGCFVSTLFLN